MDSIGEHHHTMLQHWQRIAGGHPDHQPYANPPHFMLPQNSIESQHSPVNSVEGGFPYHTPPSDGKPCYIYIL